MKEEFTDALVAISRHFGVMERDQICCGTVTIPQCVALQRLRRGVCDASSLADHLGTSRSATTRLVDGMERNGWLRRRRDPEDGRRVLLVLTDDGEAQADELRQSTEEMAEQLLAMIPESEWSNITEALTLLEEALSRCRKSCCA